MKNILLILMLILLINFRSYSQQYQCRYFPMEVGKSWTYVNSETKDTLISSILDTATINGKLYFSFVPFNTNSNLPTYWLRPNLNQIFALNMLDTTEYLLFDFQAELNESWEIPPDSSQWNTPVNQCLWGTSISLLSNSDTVENPNRNFNNCFHFGHFNHTCIDHGIGDTWFESDFGAVRFTQFTFGGILDWHLIVEKPDTIELIGKYSIIGNPCLSVPCIPGVVSALETTDTYFILASEGSWFWNGNFSWNGYTPNYGDSVIVNGIITNRWDIYGQKYFTLEIIDFTNYSITSVTNSHDEIPQIYSLSQNHPNPFNPTTSISYYIPREGDVSLRVYDLLGNEISVLEDRFRSAGTYLQNFDGSKLTSGIYLYVIRVNNFIRAKKMLLIK